MRISQSRAERTPALPSTPKAGLGMPVLSSWPLADSDITEWGRTHPSSPLPSICTFSDSPHTPGHALLWPALTICTFQL